MAGSSLGLQRPNTARTQEHQTVQEQKAVAGLGKHRGSAQEALQQRLAKLSRTVSTMQVWQQDENSAAPLPRRDAGGGAKSAAGAWYGPDAIPGKLLAGPGARKALGNITNQQGQRTPGAAMGPRKALGDITNTTPGPAKLRAEQGKHTVVQHALGAALAACVADESPEQLAGMGWQELEAARHAQSNAKISARLAAIATAPSYNPFLRQDPWRQSVPEEAEQCARPPSQPDSPAKEQPGPAVALAADELEVYRDDWSLDVWD